MYLAVAVGWPEREAWESRGAIGPHPCVTVARRVRHEPCGPSDPLFLEPASPQGAWGGTSSKEEEAGGGEAGRWTDDDEGGEGGASVPGEERQRQRRPGRDGAGGGGDARGGSASEWQAAHTSFVVAQRRRFGDGQGEGEAAAAEALLRGAQPGACACHVPCIGAVPLASRRRLAEAGFLRRHCFIPCRFLVMCR